jgi:precorrin-8X/cobalt-precorrin-8 methylmutase
MKKSNYINLNPGGIEADSMEIIGRELAHLQIPAEYEKLIKRVIHTTADFEYAHLFEAHPEAVERGRKALQQACRIYADTGMIVAGVSKPALQKLGCELSCFVHDAQVIREAKAQGITRSICGINKAASDQAFRIYVIGNAPTALVRLCELYAEGKVQPDLVIGVPVGFVGAAESKQMLKESGLPYLIIRGRKGGSTVGVALLNALLYELVQRD